MGHICNLYFKTKFGTDTSFLGISYFKNITRCVQLNLDSETNSFENVFSVIFKIVLIKKY